MSTKKAGFAGRGRPEFSYSCEGISYARLLLAGAMAAPKSAEQAEQAAAQVLAEILSRVADTLADHELDRRARHQAVQDSLRAVLAHVHAAYLPCDSVPAGLYLHAQWLPGSEPPEPAPDPWLRGALRVVARAAPSQQPADEAEDQPQRQGLPSALLTHCSPAK